MNPLAIKGIGLILVIALLIGLGYHRGSSSAMREFLPQIEQLKAVIEASDARAQEIVTEQEKNHDQIAESHSNNVARVIQFYDRMLREARNKASTSPAAERAIFIDGAACEPRACESDIEFAQNCALDAIKVIGFQDWIIANHIPVQ